MKEIRKVVVQVADVDLQNPIVHLAHQIHHVKVALALEIVFQAQRILLQAREADIGKDLN